MKHWGKWSSLLFSPQIMQYLVSKSFISSIPTTAIFVWTRFTNGSWMVVQRMELGLLHYKNRIFQMIFYVLNCIWEYISDWFKYFVIDEKFHTVKTKNYENAHENRSSSGDLYEPPASVSDERDQLRIRMIRMGENWVRHLILMLILSI